MDFPELLDLVARTVPGMRIRFATSHPKDMSDKYLRPLPATLTSARLSTCLFSPAATQY